MLYLRKQRRQAPAAVYMYCRRDYPVRRMWPVGKPNSHTYVVRGFCLSYQFFLIRPVVKRMKVISWFFKVETSGICNINTAKYA
jgi:hypothetical protein